LTRSAPKARSDRGQARRYAVGGFVALGDEGAAAQPSKASAPPPPAPSPSSPEARSSRGRRRSRSQ
jgi:hypothetical protein